MSIKGKITLWNDDKGFGFITPIRGGVRTFVHIKAFSNRKRRPEINQLVTYNQATDKQGRPCAVQVMRAGDKPAKKRARGESSLPLWITIFFLVMVSISILLGKTAIWLILLYLSASLFTFLIYAVDKSAAMNNNWRIQESTLHILALVGGWPGAVIAQRMLRHKTKKQSFRVVFWITVLINCGIFAGWHTDKGANILHTFFNSII